MILYGCTAYFSWYFNPRPPRGGRLIYDFFFLALSVISIHAPREGGDTVTGYNVWYTYISIHAPREGGDYAGLFYRDLTGHISIHAPREGGDRVISMKICD